MNNQANIYNIINNRYKFKNIFQIIKYKQQISLWSYKLNTRTKQTEIYLN